MWQRSEEAITENDGDVHVSKSSKNDAFCSIFTGGSIKIYN